MPAQLASQADIRTAATWDTAPFVTALVPVLAQTELAWWLHPKPETRLNSIRGHLRHLAGHRQPTVTIRVITDGATVAAAAVWTTCPAATHPPAELIVPGEQPHPTRAAWLHTTATQHHPPHAHDHLLLIATATAHQHHGLGTALLTDTHRTPGAPTRPAYTLLPSPLDGLALSAGYQHCGQPIPFAATPSGTVQPWESTDADLA
ncbi:hypothetical protein ACQPZJ_44735 [Actinoplanes sp. CA-054009]